MNWSIGLRAIAYLRRIARANESLAASMATIAGILSAEYSAAHPVKRRVKTDFGVMDRDEVTKQWRADRAKDMIGDEAEEGEDE